MRAVGLQQCKIPEERNVTPVQKTMNEKKLLSLLFSSTTGGWLHVHGNVLDADEHAWANYVVCVHESMLLAILLSCELFMYL